MFNVDLKNVMVSDTGRGPCFSESNDERARGNGFYQTEMIYALKTTQFPKGHGQEYGPQVKRGL